VIILSGAKGTAVTVTHATFAGGEAKNRPAA